MNVTEQMEKRVVDLQAHAYSLHMQADRFYYSDILATSEYVSRYNELARAAAEAEQAFRSAEQELIAHWESETDRRYNELTEGIL